MWHKQEADEWSRSRRAGQEKDTPSLSLIRGGLTQFVMLSLALIGIINVMPVCNKHSLLSGPNTWGIFLILYTALALNKLTDRLAIYTYIHVHIQHKCGLCLFTILYYN